MHQFFFWVFISSDGSINFLYKLMEGIIIVLLYILIIICGRNPRRKIKKGEEIKILFKEYFVDEGYFILYSYFNKKRIILRLLIAQD